MECICQICGAHTSDEKECEKALKSNICPVCLSVGSIVDRGKCGQEYSLCKRCKHEDNIDLWAEKCQYCTRVVDIGYSMILCGIPIGSGISYLHQNFEEKVVNNDE